jgi:hypothetical protein
MDLQPDTPDQDRQKWQQRQWHDRREPATSTIRELMMRIGLISRVEESGNVSYDFGEQSGFRQVLGDSGFDRIVYRRELWSLLVSELRPANLWPARVVAERLFDLLHSSIGRRWGTKLTIVAWRTTPPSRSAVASLRLDAAAL